MAGKDKHPPLDPNRHSTNKRVKPGDKNKTTAKFAKAVETKSEKTAKRNVANSLAGQKKSEDVQRAALKRGYLTQNETLILQKRKKSRKPVI